MTFATLPAKTDPPAVTLLAADSPRLPVLCCDHARNMLPAALGTWGLSAEDRVRHIAWDPGAEALTRALSASLGLAAVISGYSRLLVDVNRYPDDPAAFPVESDGSLIPGNQALSAAERAARWEAIAGPYHRALAQTLRARDEGTQLAPLIAVHSFNPVLGADIRAIQIGLIHHVPAVGPPLGEPLLRWLQSEATGWVIGDNDPYPIDQPRGLTLFRHGVDVARPCVGIEVRNDLLGTDEGVAAVADLLGRGLAAVLSLAAR